VQKVKEIKEQAKVITFGWNFFWAWATLYEAGGTRKGQEKGRYRHASVKGGLVAFDVLSL
jgi:hypothetical protein